MRNGKGYQEYLIFNTSKSEYYVDVYDGISILLSFIVQYNYN